MTPTALVAVALLSAVNVDQPTVGVSSSTVSPDQASVSFSSSTITITRTSGQLDFGVSDCVNDVATTFTATFSSPVPIDSTLAIFLSDSTLCATRAPSGAIRSVTDINNTVTLAVSARDVVGAGTTCPAATIQRAVCVLATSSSAVSNAAFLTLTFHGEPPNTPTLKQAAGGDGVAHLKWDATGSLAHVTVYFRPLNPGFGSEADPCDSPAIVEVDAGLNGSTAAGSGTAGAGDGGMADAGFDVGLFSSMDSKSTSGDLVEGLTNGATYLFFTVAVDQFGNVSDQSNALTTTPQLVQDFYRRYRCEGGRDRGGLGCATAGAAAVAPALAALALALRRRRGRRRW